LEAASSSTMLKEALSSKEIHELHLLQAVTLSIGFLQFITLAKILAQVVFPTPLGPVNKNAWAS
jgi:ABC-type hemin transport system ATPase subunit